MCSFLRISEKTHLALEAVRPEVGDEDKAAIVADINMVRIRDLEESLAKELGCAVRDLTIALHLSETQTTISESKHINYVGNFSKRKHQFLNPTKLCNTTMCHFFLFSKEMAL